jgi:hypothetical protein
MELDSLIIVILYSSKNKRVNVKIDEIHLKWRVQVWSIPYPTVDDKILLGIRE